MHVGIENRKCLEGSWILLLVFDCGWCKYPVRLENEVGKRENENQDRKKGELGQKHPVEKLGFFTDSE